MGVIQLTLWEYPEVIHCPSDSVFSWSCARIVRTLGFYFTFLSSLSGFSLLLFYLDLVILTSSKQAFKHSSEFRVHVVGRQDLAIPAQHPTDSPTQLSKTWSQYNHSLSDPLTLLWSKKRSCFEKDVSTSKDASFDSIEPDCILPFVKFWKCFCAARRQRL